MLHIYPNARTTPAVRAEIARSTEPSGIVARRYGISAETVRKWRKRGISDCLDRSARPHRLSWKASKGKRAVVYALRRATNFPFNDFTFVVCHVLPHLNRDSVWRILKAKGLNRRSRSVHMAVKDDETGKSAIAFLREAAAAFSFRLTHVLTDNGSGSHARLRPCLRQARRGVSPHQAAHAADQRHGRALQRTDWLRGTEHHHLLAP